MDERELRHSYILQWVGGTYNSMLGCQKYEILRYSHVKLVSLERAAHAINIDDPFVPRQSRNIYRLRHKLVV